MLASKPKNVAKEWLIFVGCFVLGVVLNCFEASYHANARSGSGVDVFWNEHFGGPVELWAWFLWFVPYLVVMLARSIVWSISTLRATIPGAISNETAKRAKALCAKLDPHLNGDSAEAIVRNAMEGGATTANDFAQAFENAGMKKDLSISAGKVIETHLNVAAAERVTAEKPID